VPRAGLTSLPRAAERPGNRLGNKPRAGDHRRLELVDVLLAEEEPRPCVVATLRWMQRHGGVERGLCALIEGDGEGDGSHLVGFSGAGVSLATVDSFQIDLANRAHPFVLALVGAEPVAFHTAVPELGSPFGEQPFHAVPLAGPGSAGEIGPGLLLVTGRPDADGYQDAEVRWAAELLGVRLVSLWYRRAQADERRHKQERTWLFGIVNAVTDPILLTDTAGRMLVANASAESLLASDEAMSEGRRRAVALNNMLFSSSLFTSVQESSQPTRRELLLVDPTDGQDLLFELMSTPVRVRRGEMGVVSVLRNDTDLRRASEEIEENYRRLRVAEAQTRAERDRLDLILNGVLDPVLVTDADDDIVRMNPPAERLFTVRPGSRSEEAERRVRANDAVFTSFVSNLYTGQSLRWRGELTLLDPVTGASVPVEAISGKVATRPGDEGWTVTILHDLTEAVEKAELYEQVKRHSEELKERVSEATAELAEQNELLRRQALALEQASAMKSQFLANVSHELRTPLNAILGYTQLLLEGISGELNRPQRDKLARIDSNGHHLLAVINDLLDIARIESGKMSVHLELLHIPELIDEVMSEVEPLIARTNLEVTRTLPGDLPAIRSDRKKLKQILLNLLSNALKFTPQGSVSIRAVCEPGTIAIAVADTGIGISEENQRTIFEAFAQTDSSYVRRAGGTGLGLSICRRLADLLGGDISLVSRQGEGSVFTLLLPVA
jgi:signal transduction histidine kinase